MDLALDSLIFAALFNTVILYVSAKLLAMELSFQRALTVAVTISMLPWIIQGVAGAFISVIIYFTLLKLLTNASMVRLWCLSVTNAFISAGLLLLFFPPVLVNTLK